MRFIVVLLSLFMLQACSDSKARQVKESCQLNSKENVIVIYTAEWCGACKYYKQQYQELNEQKPFNYRVIDVDKDKDFECPIPTTPLPTTVLFKGGKSTKLFVGASKELLQKLTKEL